MRRIVERFIATVGIERKKRRFSFLETIYMVDDGDGNGDGDGDGG